MSLLALTIGRVRLDDFAGIVVAIGIAAYLVYVLVHPERV
jgi:K+-transporting ATPase KdpF subunit